MSERGPDAWVADGVPWWLWRGVLDALDEGVIVLGADGVLLDASASVLAAMGVARDDAVGRVVPAAFSDPQRPAWRALAGEAFEAELITERELPEGRAVLRTRTVPVAGAAVQVVSDMTPRLTAERRLAREAAEIEELNAELRRVLGRISVARELERSEISRVLHAEVLTRLGALHSDVAAVSATAAAALESCIAALGQLEIGPRSRTLDTEGLEAALVELAGDARTPCRVTVAGDLGAPGQPFAAVVWRNVREALRNVDAHAGASVCTVEVAAEPGWAHCTVRDDGHGVDDRALERAAGEGHIGVLTMREGAESAGGSFRLGAGPDGGCEVRFSVPVVDPGVPGVAGAG